MSEFDKSELFFYKIQKKSFNKKNAKLEKLVIKKQY